MALAAARQLAQDLETRIVLLVAKVAPYPLPVDNPPGFGRVYRARPVATGQRARDGDRDQALSLP